MPVGHDDQDGLALPLYGINNHSCVWLVSVEQYQAGHRLRVDDVFGSGGHVSYFLFIFSSDCVGTGHPTATQSAGCAWDQNDGLAFSNICRTRRLGNLDLIGRGGAWGSGYFEA